MKLTPIIFIILAVGIYFVYTQPQNEKFSEIEEQKESLEQTQEAANNLEETRDSLQEDYSDIGDDNIERLRKMLPNSVENVRLIRDLDKLSENKYGISITNIAISDNSNASEGSTSSSSDDGDEGGDELIIENSNEEYGTIKMSFSLTAGYEDFKLFMRDLESSLRLLDVKEINVNATQSSLYVYSVVLDTYWLR